MKTLRISLGSALGATALGALLAAVHVPASAEGATVYRCPGPPVLYTDAISAQEAQKRGCRTIEGAPITVMKTVKPAPVQGSGPHESKVDQNEQRARDADARRILEAELKREQDNLAALKQEYNNGQPERRGDERNYAKYQERVDSLKNAIARKEADIEALKREIAKHGS